MAGSSVLNLMPCLQSWDGNNILLRLLALPRVNPLDPLVPAGPSFATADLVFDVRAVSASRVQTTFPPLGAPRRASFSRRPRGPQRRQLHDGLSAQFPIDPNTPTPPARSISIYKHLPQTYREASGYTGGRTPFGVTDDRYRCALNPPPVPNPVRTPRPPIPTTVSWAKVIAAALRQRLLAEALGLAVPLSRCATPPDFFKAGGFVYITLASASDAYALTATPGALALYAARVPPLAAARQLFSPALFPVGGCAARCRLRRHLPGGHRLRRRLCQVCARDAERLGRPARRDRHRRPPDDPYRHPPRLGRRAGSDLAQPPDGSP